MQMLVLNIMVPNRRNSLISTTALIPSISLLYLGSSIPSITHCPMINTLISRPLPSRRLIGNGYRDGDVLWINRRSVTVKDVKSCGLISKTEAVSAIGVHKETVTKVTESL
jgi:hypothetical protein